MPTNSTEISNEKVITEIGILVGHLVEILSDLLIKSSTNANATSNSVNIAKASTLLSDLTNGGDIQQQKEFLSSLFNSFQFKSHVEVATQVINKNIS
jgi:hypothetical protein